MAIDWKTIISEFDGKPTLLQAIGKLRKAVEDETITIQQAQAEIAKLESQQKADEALITTAQTTASNAQSAAQAADTKAQNALDLATTNETNIGTLDGKVAQIETNLSNKQNKIYKHYVYFTAEFGTLYSDGNIQALIYTSSSTPFTFNDFYNYVYDNAISVYGSVLDGNGNVTVIGFPIYMTAIYSKLYLSWFKFSENKIVEESVTSESCYINDTVTEV